MYKVIALVLLVLIGSVSAHTNSLKLKSKHIQLASSVLKQGHNGLDWCPQCIDTWNDLVEAVLDVILQYGILDTCGNLCDLVAEKTGSDILGFICTFGCDVLGLEEFVKIMDKADIDPIYYCEKMKICPINDNGDAKFKSFVILPQSAPQGTKFGIDFVYVSNNGTGTGEMILTIKTVDKVPITAGFLVEAQQPGTYGDRISLDTTPDPECDPTEEQCEEWLPGTYNVTVMLCNGQCGSHHPHTQLYDVASGIFYISGR